MARRQPLLLAIDLGSSSVRAALFRANGVRLAGTLASRKYAIKYSGNGAADLDPAVLLLSTKRCVAETLRSAPPGAVVAVAGSAFWHGLLGLDARNRPLTPILTWADSRSTGDAAELRAEVDERNVQLRTGCMVRAQFWPAKLRWLRRTDRAVFRRVARWVSPASWIFGELLGVNTVSHSMASATGCTISQPLLGTTGCSTFVASTSRSSIRCATPRRSMADRQFYGERWCSPRLVTGRQGISAAVQTAMERSRSTSALAAPFASFERKSQCARARFRADVSNTSWTARTL